MQVFTYMPCNKINKRCPCFWASSRNPQNVVLQFEKRFCLFGKLMKCECTITLLEYGVVNKVKTTKAINTHYSLYPKW